MAQQAKEDHGKPVTLAQQQRFDELYAGEFASEGQSVAECVREALAEDPTLYATARDFYLAGLEDGKPVVIDDD